MSGKGTCRLHGPFRFQFPNAHPAEPMGHPSVGGSAAGGSAHTANMVSDNRKHLARQTCVLASAQGSDSLPDGSDGKFTFGQHV